MPLARTSLDMKAEHWEKLREMALAAEPGLSGDEVETLIHAPETIAFIMAKRPIMWRPLIDKYVSRLKVGG